MAFDEKKLQLRMKEFEDVCRKAGLKRTAQRMEIFREVARSQDHPDAETVHESVRKRLPTVSLDTVYRTLWTLQELGLVTVLGHSHERHRFDATLENHHHFVCNRCGMTRDLYGIDLGEIRLPASAKAFGNITSTHLEARGVCKGCQKKAKSKKKASSR